MAKLCSQSSDIDGVFKDLDSEDEPEHDAVTGEIKQDAAPQKKTTGAAEKVKQAMSEQPEVIDV